MNGKLSIIISAILVTAAILTVQSLSSMLQISYAQSCPDGSTPDASGNCPTLPTPPADEEETAEAPPPAGDGETAQAPPPATTVTPPPATAPPATTVTPPPATAPPATTVTPPPATAPPAVVSPQVSNNTANATLAGANATVFINTILEIHNRERAAVGVPPLVWNDSLAADAKSWIDHLVATGQIAHASYGERKAEGENIAWSSDLEVRGMAGSWANEKNGYQVAPFQWDRDKAHGHYTQMVTWDVKAVGCAIGAAGPQGEPFSGQVTHYILVCRYSPSHANVDGYAPYTTSPNGSTPSNST